MSLAIRLILIIIAILCLLFMLSRIRKSGLKIEATVFWVLFSILLIIMAVIPAIPIGIAHLLGVDSPANLVFAFIIFLLLIKQFMQTIEFSKMEEKFNKLTRHIAIKEYEETENHER